MRPDSIATVERLSLGHRRVVTAISIDAPPDAVWAILTDWETVPDWSRGIQRINGELRDGSDVVVDYLFRGFLNQLPRKLLYREGEAFGWSHEVLPGIRHNHLYRLEALPTGATRFHQTDEVKGGMTSMALGWLLARWFKDSFEEFNVALKERVESR